MSKVVEGYEFVTSADRLGEVANSLERQKFVGFDLETTSLQPHEGKIRIVSLSTEEKIWVIDVWKTGRPDKVIEALRRKDLIKLGQNLKFDMKWCLHEWQLELDPVFDTMVGSAVLAGGIPGTTHSLDSISARFLALPMDKTEQRSDWAGELTQSQKDYAANDVRWLMPIRLEMIPRLQKMSLVNVTKLELDALLPVAAMELRGLAFDKPRWEKLVEEQMTARIAAEKKIEEILSPYMRNVQGVLPGFQPPPSKMLTSPKELLKLLNRLGEEDGVEELKALAATNKNDLKMVGDSHEVIEHLLAFRKSEKAITTYGDEFTNHLCKHCNRIHPSYWPFTGAGRYACRDPNMQNIPRDKRYRACFVAGEGYVFIVADYSQIELRIAAEMSGDVRMLEVFHNPKGDIHRTTAASIAGKKEELVSAEDRQRAKAVNFGLVYGMGADRLKEYAKTDYNVDMSDAQAEKAHKQYFKTYREIRPWQEKMVESGQKKHQVRTMSGRIRFLGEDKFSEFMNSPVQGTGADGLKVSMRLVYDRLKGKDAYVVHTVHDELIVEARPDDVEEVKMIVEKSMIEGMECFLEKVPVTVVSHTGPNWSEAKA